MKKILLLISVLFVQIGFGQTIDRSQSKIEFEVKKMGKIVHGTILGIEGTVNFDENNLSKSRFVATVVPADIDTKVKARDKHLQQDNFFAVEQFPKIIMTSKSIIKNKQGYQATANLRIKDINMEVVIPFTVERKGSKQILEGTFSVNRKDFDLGKKMGKVFIGLDVVIHIKCAVTI